MEYKFTKEELIDLLEMTCSLQKGNDYQKAGNILFDEDIANIALKSNELLDYLSVTDNNIISDDRYSVDEIIELTKKWK
jgi:predicted ribosome quality control (RQC) complex YloA/Tae2 family protein